MEQHDDLVWIQRTLAGDQKAFAGLVDRHKNMVFSIALKVLRNREEAEEIAQDCFVKAYQSLKTYKGDSKFSTWLYRIVYNAAISQTRKRKQEFVEMNEHISDHMTEDEIVANLDTVSSDQQAELLKKAIDRLPAEESAIITLFYNREMSVDDISRVTGLSEANVKVKLHRIRKKLYEMLQYDMQKLLVY
jgi:RNA polymerase sigma-70 factor, ECF subfamily